VGLEHLDEGDDGTNGLLVVRSMASLTTCAKPELPSGFAELLLAFDNCAGGRPSVGLTPPELGVMVSMQLHITD
jgi:hypothetical protein